MGLQHLPKDLLPRVPSSEIQLADFQTTVMDGGEEGADKFVEEPKDIDDADADEAVSE